MKCKRCNWPRPLEWIEGYWDEENGNLWYMAVCPECGLYNWTQNHNDVIDHLLVLKL